MEVAEAERRFLTGNEACALGAMYAGLDFFAGYPITPSTEIAEFLSRELPRRGGVFIQMEDEIASLAAVLGASIAGARAMTATSGPGFSLMQEHIGYGAMAEVPCVVVNVQRGGPSTGLPTMPAQGDVMQARYGSHGDYATIALVPSSVEETFALTVRAFNLSERFRCPVLLMLDEIVGHVAERCAIPVTGQIQITQRRSPRDPPEAFLPYRPDSDGVPPMAGYGEGYRFHVTGLNHDETGFPSNEPRVADALVRRLTEKVEAYRDEIVEVEWTRAHGARVGIFAYGSSARAARGATRALAADGLPVTLLRPTVLWPFPDQEVRQLAAEVDLIVVPEMNLGQMAREVEGVCRGAARVDRLTRVDGLPITPNQIAEMVQRVA
jgi:2-oxoglutarate ferredoxin oxidoreductase subunit alpha